MLLSESNGDYVPNLSTLAQQKYNAIVAVGFLMADATNTVASKMPTFVDGGQPTPLVIRTGLSDS